MNIVMFARCLNKLKVTAIPEFKHNPRGLIGKFFKPIMYGGFYYEMAEPNAYRWDNIVKPLLSIVELPDQIEGHQKLLSISTHKE
jgi:hypothetical protein